MNAGAKSVFMALMLLAVQTPASAASCEREDFETTVSSESECLRTEASMLSFKPFQASNTKMQ
jgi:hypothetical protein